MGSATRFDASTDALTGTGTTGLPTTTYTVTVWLYISATTGSYGSPVSIWDSTAASVYSTLDLVTESSDGTTLTTRSGNGATHLGAFTQSTATWYFAAITASGTSVTLWHGDESLGALSSTSGTLTLATTPDTIAVGTNIYGNYFNGRVAAVKIWNAVLSQTELNAEAAQYAPARTTNLLRYYPLNASPATADQSGNGYNLTAGSTGTVFETGPSIPDVAGVAERFAPDAILAQTGLTGAVAAIQDDPDSPDGNWLVG